MNVGWKVESNNGKLEAVLIHNINAYLFDEEEIDEPSYSEESSDALLVINLIDLDISIVRKTFNFL